MSRVPLAEQCRVIKPREPNDTKVYYCQRALYHPGGHSSGKHYRWSRAYEKEKKA